MKEVSVDVGVVRAAPAHAEGIAALYEKVYAGKYPLAEFQDPRFIAGAVQDSRYKWFVAQKGGAVVGSTVGVVAPWNNSCELGKTVVDPGEAGAGVAKQMCARMRDSALEEGVEVLWGALRNEQMTKIARHDGLVLVGYLPGAHRVENREIHLLGYRLSDEARRKRVAPLKNHLYDLPGFQRICAEFALPVAQGEYPKEVVVNPGLCANAEVGVLYHPFDKSWVVTRWDGVLDVPEYIELTVLADKVDEIDKLVHAEFEQVAFLPAWYERDGKRYDCIRLARALRRPLASDRSIQPLMYALRRDFGLES